MRKIGRRLLCLCGTAAVSVLMSICSFAGEWKQEGELFWQKRYVEADGSYTKGNWQEIDGRKYHFDWEGYMDAGFRSFIGEQYYHLLRSGAMETNQDYGVGYLDGEGLWHWNERADYSTFFRLWGIDFDSLYQSLLTGSQASVSCSMSLFPKDSEGNPAMSLVTETIVKALETQRRKDKAWCSYEWITNMEDYDGTQALDPASTYTMTIRALGSSTILYYQSPYRDSAVSDRWQMINGDWYCFDQGVLQTVGNWEGGCLLADGSLYYDNIDMDEAYKLTYARDAAFAPSLPLYVQPAASSAEHMYHVGFDGQNYYYGTQEWKEQLMDQCKEAFNAILNANNDSAVSQMFTMNFQLPANYEEQCPPPILFHDLYEWMFFDSDYGWEWDCTYQVDANNMLTIIVEYVPNPQWQ